MKAPLLPMVHEGVHTARKNPISHEKRLRTRRMTSSGHPASRRTEEKREVRGQVPLRGSTNQRGGESSPRAADSVVKAQTTELRSNNLRGELQTTHNDR